MLRGERDQNTAVTDGWWPARIPECSGGSEIKTLTSCFRIPPAGYQNAPGGARSKQVGFDSNYAVKIPECSGGSEIKTWCTSGIVSTTRYQNAPGGARSKHESQTDQAEFEDTRMLRGERDQNKGIGALIPVLKIPECSGGSEIKTCILV